MIFIDDQADIVAGEAYSGGSGFDILVIEAATPVDISAVSINSDIERLEALDTVSLTASQLGNFTSLRTGTVTLTTGGTADLSDANDLDSHTFNLNAAGNTIDLSGNSLNGYVVIGAGGTDIIIGGDHAGGDTLVGGGGNDQLTGGGGADHFWWTSNVSGNDTLLDFSGVTAFGGGNGEGDKLEFIGLLNGGFEYLGSDAFDGSGNSEARFAANATLHVDSDGNGVTDIAITISGFAAANQLQDGDFLWT